MMAGPEAAHPLFSGSGLLSLLTLSAMEIVLGIDNIVFLTILSSRLPAHQQAQARRIGLILALGMRLGLLTTLSWLMGLTKPLFAVFGHGFSGRDLILLMGGLFLLGKSTHEIFEQMESATPGGKTLAVEESEDVGRRASSAFALTLVQIALLDIVFSLDSVLTAIGMAQHLLTMVVAMILAVVTMLLFVGKVSQFIQRHPSLKLLALAFLLLIGFLLVAESLGQHVNKGYIYFAMGFSLLVELLNLRLRGRAKAQR
jgi:predicted tellurium resistance membrane protein TerC